MEINIKDKLKNISGEKIKGNLMHEVGIGKIVIIIVCGIIILSGGFWETESKKDNTDVNNCDDNDLSEDEALNIMNKYAKHEKTT